MLLANLASKLLFLFLFLMLSSFLRVDILIRDSDAVLEAEAVSNYLLQVQLNGQERQQSESSSLFFLLSSRPQTFTAMCSGTYLCLFLRYILSYLHRYDTVSSNEILEDERCYDSA